jgi:putative alpha-1,2-mannosidase
MDSSIENHTMKRSILFIFACILALSCGKQVSYIDFVDTSIGTGGHGHVFVGASVPFGMVQLGPTSIPQDWDWCSGYHESALLSSVSLTHISAVPASAIFLT